MGATRLAAARRASPHRVEGLGSGVPPGPGQLPGRRRAQRARPGRAREPRRDGRCRRPPAGRRDHVPEPDADPDRQADPHAHSRADARRLPRRVPPRRKRLGVAERRAVRRPARSSASASEEPRRLGPERQRRAVRIGQRGGLGISQRRAVASTRHRQRRAVRFGQRGSIGIGQQEARHRPASSRPHRPARKHRHRPARKHRQAKLGGSVEPSASASEAPSGPVRHPRKRHRRVPGRDPRPRRAARARHRRGIGPAESASPSGSVLPETGEPPIIVTKVDDQGTKNRDDDQIVGGAKFEIRLDDGDGVYEPGARRRRSPRGARRPTVHAGTTQTRSATT